MAVFQLGRNKKKLLTVTALCIVGFIASAATSVTNELLTQPEERRRALDDMRNWCSTIVLDLPAGQRNQWQQTADNHPLAVLRACTVNDTTGK